MKNRKLIVYKILITVFVTIAFIMAFAFDLRSSDAFWFITNGVKYIPNWKYAGPYLAFIILAFCFSIADLISDYKNGITKSNSIQNSINYVLILKILLPILLIVNSASIVLLGNVTPETLFIPTRPLFTSISICFTFADTLTLFILQIMDLRKYEN